MIPKYLFLPWLDDHFWMDLLSGLLACAHIVLERAHAITLGLSGCVDLFECFARDAETLNALWHATVNGDDVDDRTNFFFGHAVGDCAVQV